MTQYFAISQQPKLFQKLSSISHLSYESTLLKQNLLIYPNFTDNCLVLLEIKHEINSQNREKKERKIYLPKQLQKQKISHIVNLNANKIANKIDKRNVNQHNFILTTHTKIYLIKLNKLLSQIVQICECFHLIIEPHLNTAQLRHRVTNIYKLLNQQILHIEEQNKLLVCGFDKNRRIIVNSYCYNLQGKPNLKLITQCHLQYHKQTQKNYYNYAFTISEPLPSYPIIYIHPTANEKGLAVKLYKYNLHNMLNTADPENGVIKCQQQISELFCIHNYVHVKCVYAEGSDIYICYTQYVPFAKNSNEGKQKANSKFSHLWIYSLNAGYTRNIIDLDGFMLSTKIIKPQADTNMAQSIKTLAIVTMESKQQANQQNKSKIAHKATFVNMDSSKYHPFFQISTFGYPLVLQHKQSYICEELRQSQQQQIVHELVSHDKINKGILYCKIWSQMGMGSESFLYSILNMLEVI